MPTYEYACQACNHAFELEQRITEPPISTCPSCLAEAATRKISAPMFLLKGGGWYADGYASRRPSGSPEAPRATGSDD